MPTTTTTTTTMTNTTTTTTTTFTTTTTTTTTTWGVTCGHGGQRMGNIAALTFFSKIVDRQTIHLTDRLTE